MTPVINPWIFYLMPICDNLGFICAVCGILAGVGAIVACCMYTVLSSDPDFYEESAIAIAKKFRRVLVPAAIVLVLLGTFIPSESTITKMLIAENVTYERVETATNTVESVYNDIMDLFEEDDNG